MKKDSSLRCSSSYPARYLNLFCASEEEIIQGQVKVSLYSGVLRLHHSWLQASKLKWSIICIEVLQEKKTTRIIVGVVSMKFDKNIHRKVCFPHLRMGCRLQKTV